MRNTTPAYLILLLLILMLLCLPPVVWAQGPTPAPPPTPAPAKALTEAEARTRFAAQDAARAAAPEGTEERAQAAGKAEPLARFIAWKEFDAGHYDEAATWFARRAALEHEDYANEVTFYETVSKAQTDQQVAKWGPISQSLRTRLDKVTDPKIKADLQNFLDGIPDDIYSLKAGQLSSVEIWLKLSGDLPKLLDYYQQNVALGNARLSEMKAAGMPSEKRVKMQEKIAKAMEQVGDTQAQLAQFDAAEKTYQDALALRNSLPADDAERDIAESLSDLARLYGDQGDLPHARDFYTQALKALDDNQPALKKALAAGPTPEQASLPQKDIDQSLGVFRQSLTMNDTMSRGVALNNLGIVVEDMGDYKAALDYYNRAIAVNETLQTDGPLSSMIPSNTLAVFKAAFLVKDMSNIATLHGDSGATDQAIQEELTVLELDKRLGEGTATDLVNLGSLYQEKGDVEKARQYMEQARREFAANQDQSGLIGAVLGLAGLASDAAKLPAADPKQLAAEDYAKQAQAIAGQIGNLSWRSAAARRLADVRLQQGSLDAADTLLIGSEADARKVGAPLALEDTLYMEGRVLEARGKLEEAFAKYKDAIKLLTDVRLTTASAADFSNLKSSYRVYEHIVQLLIKMGRTAKAFDYYNDAGSARLQDSLRQSTVKTRDPALQALLDIIKNLQVKQKAIMTQLEEERDKPEAEQNVAKIQSLERLYADDRKKFFDIVDDPSSRSARVVPVEPQTLDKAQPSIPPDIALIEYAPRGDRLGIFVVTHDGTKFYPTTVNPADLLAHIKAVREQMTIPDSAAPAVRGTVAVSTAAPGPTLTDNLAALYDMLIAPIASDIAAKKTLAFIPSQSLFYLPMQALGRKEGDGLHYLIQDKEIVYLAGADVLAALTYPASATRKGGLVAFGNPTGANLPHAQAEVEAIGHLFPTSTIYVGTHATKDAFDNPKVYAASILHLATHGHLDANHPNNSYIFLANGADPIGQLTFEDIQEMLLNKADLVTLSACQTALQGQDPSGTEVASLAEAFSRAHVHTVVASLWSVADESTQTLMVAFYKNLAAGQSKAAALRAAQIQLLNDPRTAHPYYWAPFILMGDWK